MQLKHPIKNALGAVVDIFCLDILNGGENALPAFDRVKKTALKFSLYFLYFLGIKSKGF